MINSAVLMKHGITLPDEGRLTQHVWNENTRAFIPLNYRMSNINWKKILQSPSEFEFSIVFNDWRGSA